MTVKKKRTNRVGPLTIIASILLLSAGLRLIGVSGEAFASNAVASDAVQDGGSKIKRDSPEKLDAVLESFDKREQAIEARETELQERFVALEEAETSLRAQLEALQKAEQRLRDVLSIADSAAEDDVARLTAVYENMKPKGAAVVFEQMQPAFAAGFLARMRPDAAAAIMAGLSPQSAYAISVTLAGRHSEPKTKNP